ncbi:hypothetical protein Tco_1415640 [Tanacetum coccineum]
MLAGPIYELMKGSCKSLVELEYFLEEVCKATTDQLDWNNPEGQQYPHDLCKPLQLIPNSRGRRVIPFDHLINNDLAYLSGGVSSRTYANLVTKKKAADYGHVKWIEDLIPNSMWRNLLVMSTRDTRSLLLQSLRLSNGIITNRLHLPDIEDMLLLIVQGKLTNLNAEECLALGNKDKKNRLMRIDELHKFSDDAHNDVQSALDDILKRIRMEYLPQTVWRNVNREKEGAMV